MTKSEPNNTASSVDLTNCDREPIHLAGAVQPHGALLAFQLGDLTLRHASTNIPQWLGTMPEPGTPLASLLDDDSVLLLHKVATGLRAVVRPMQLRSRAGESQASLSAAAHVYKGMLIVELEQPRVANGTSKKPEELSLPLQLTKANQRLQQCLSLPELYQAITDEIRDMSGFDRVMLYRFAEDSHGEVIGESVVAGKEPFLGLHYPATDIPEQARRLYVLNTVRSIGDVNANPVPIVPSCHADAELPLDLSLSCFRAVSPIHIEYLQNMGVQASMSISIVIDNQLWGLIACHHYSAKPLLLEERAACEIMGLVAGNYLSARVQSEVNKERVRRRQHYHHVLDQITRITNIWQSVEKIWPDLREIVEASGLAVATDRKCHLIGSTPDTQTVQAIIKRLEARPEDATKIWSTHSLAESFPELSTQTVGAACGCLAVRLFAPDVNWLLFFRDEYVSEVTWAGNPEKSTIKSGDGVRLSPRKSFEEWKTTVHRQSRRWSLVDREMAEELHSGLMELLSLRAAELHRLNEELAKINADLDAFAYAASHDLREPLRGIKQTIFLLQHELGESINDATDSRLKSLSKLASRMDELVQGLLRLSRVGQANLEFEKVSLRELVEEAVEMVVGRPTPQGIEIVIAGETLLWADYLCLRELFTNLISNSLKYNTSEIKRLEIGVLEDHHLANSKETVLFVRDNGIGIALEAQQDVFQIFRRLHLPDQFGGGSGAGLTICKKIVDRHGGEIWIESEPGLGSTFLFTLEQVD
ncbi:GAF domain-containing protein [Bremerella cremea]|uniref:histidine kinase n=1 Tax=Bremerella cremea TaxID=1031537 RepID=A0A368KMI1_9BACT|nr:ATP-binding protein [Bremerella cremea]RCS41173.1 GAF domain-containing protein [Bremerella cremea]